MKILSVCCTQFISLLLMAGVALTHVSCQPVCQKLEPVLLSPLPLHRLQSLPSAFPPLSPMESKQEWGKELMIGNAFAKDSDFYRAITSYKRALVLLPSNESERRLQLDYNILLCYYLGAKYSEALSTFETSDLSQADPSFPAFNQLLLIVYESYLQTKQEEKAASVLEVIRTFSPETANDLLLYQSFKTGEVESARCLIAQHCHADSMKKEFAFYDLAAKSPRKAQILNAILPGAGYYYVGQKRSALTSFIINALFTAAAYQFFHRGYPAAGAITASLETGWYIGGINGAGIEAQEFNARLYEGMSRKILTEQSCFPILMFETNF